MLRTVCWRQCPNRYFSKSSFWRNLEKDKVQETKPVETKSSTSTPNSGSSGQVAPKKWEKFMLVFSGKYKSVADVPDRINYETMNRQKGLSRIRLSNILIVTVLLFCLYYSYKGKQMARKGDSMLKRGREMDDKLRSEVKINSEKEKLN